jgi:hypothetical protein
MERDVNAPALLALLVGDVKFEGVVLPVLVEATENRMHDWVDAFHVGEHYHRSRSSPDFHEAALDDVVGGAWLAPQASWKCEEVQQFRQIALQLRYGNI